MYDELFSDAVRMQNLSKNITLNRGQSELVCYYQIIHRRHFINRKLKMQKSSLAYRNVFLCEAIFEKSTHVSLQILIQVSHDTLETQH